MIPICASPGFEPGLRVTKGNNLGSVPQEAPGPRGVTSRELRQIRQRWDTFKTSVKLHRNTW